jgi:hypothetical protein
LQASKRARAKAARSDGAVEGRSRATVVVQHIEREREREREREYVWVFFW